MKIHSRNFPAANQLKLLNELNLKEGQRVAGRIISVNNDEAVLELAGHTIQSKIEGAIPSIGITQTFLAAIDKQGRTILKVQQNPQESNSQSLTLTKDIGLSKSNAGTPNLAMQRSVITALTKYDLPPSNENIIKILHCIQDFQVKYQQPIKAQVFTFIMAQKWPVTPATILASWVFQEPEFREQLWEKLRKPLSEQNINKQFISQLKMPSNPSEILNQLKSSNNSQVSTGLATVGTKSKTDTETNKFTTENNTDSDREKIQYILDQNIAISKAILKDTATDGAWNLIPIVVSDSHSITHEGLVQWKEENNSNSDAGDIQIVYMTIPTENLGKIDLVLRSGSSGTRINFKVSTEEVRKYFIKNMTAMKTAISKNALITININQNDDINNDIPGVDLWM